MCIRDRDTVQIKGVDSTIRTTNVVMDANSKLFVLERLMTDGDQKAESDIEVCMNGSGSSAQIISRSVGKGNSSQVFHPKAVGKNKCHAHIPVSYTHLDVYKRQEYEHAELFLFQTVCRKRYHL